MSRTARALQKLAVEIKHGDQVIQEFTVEAGEVFGMLSGNEYRTLVLPAALVKDKSLAYYGVGTGDREAAAERVDDHDNHMADGGSRNEGPYGKLYE